MQRDCVTSMTSATGIAIGQTRLHFPQLVQVASLRRMRVKPNREKGLKTAANGHNHRQNGMVVANEPTTMAPSTT